jgi:hypothetical protein
VVDGIITDRAGPYAVKILKSSSLNEDNTYVPGLSVSIEEKDGPTEILAESAPGIYYTNNLQGEVGKSYRLNINYQEQLFQSTWETIYASPAIDSIYFQIETRGTTDRETDQAGVQFFVANNGPENGARFFRYEWQEVWQLGVNWRSNFDYLGNDEAELTSNPVYRCWKQRNSTGINIGTTKGLTENVLSGHPLDFITGDQERFTERYSLLVKQYALQENEYIFWKNLRESNEELGSLFDKQPANVRENITSVTNPGEVVLGYFSAAGSQEERIFLEVQDVITELSRRPRCNAPDSLFRAFLGTEYENTLLRRLETGEFFFDFIYSDFGTILGALLTTQNCSDCTVKGGDLNKPEFWDE